LFVFEITDDPSDKFEITNNTELRLTDTAALADTSYSVTIKVTDGNKLTFTKIFTVVVIALFTSTLSFLFDGVDEFVNMSNVISLGAGDSFSFSAWVKTTAVAAQTILAKKLSGGSGAGYEVTMTAAGELQITLTKSGTTALVKRTNTTFNDGNWHHIAVTYDGSRTAAGTILYLDNVVPASTDVNDTLSGNMNNAANFNIGGKDDSVAFWNGNIDETSVWNLIALSVAEINEIYNSASPGDLAQHSAVANLTSWWKLGESDSFPTAFDSMSSNDGTMTNMEAGDIVSDAP